MPGVLADALLQQSGVLSSNLFNTPQGADGPGPLLPGDAYQFSFEAIPGSYLSFATMFVPSNDLFYAPNESGIALFDESGNPVAGDFTAELMLWDAGTEANEEPGVGPNQVQRQSGPDTGPADPDSLVRLVDDGFTYPVRAQVIRLIIDPAPTSVGTDSDGGNSAPETFGLAQNYPNPFNPETTIQYTLKQAGEVKVSIYNALGQRVRELVNSVQPAGEYRVTWNGRDASGAQVSSGIYFYRLQAAGTNLVRKMTLLR